MILVAAQMNNIKAVQMLLQPERRWIYRVRMTGTALMLAAQNGHHETSSNASTAGAHVNSQTKKGETALMFAAQNGHIEILQTLTAAGAHVHSQNKGSETALVYALEKSHTETIQVLPLARILISKLKIFSALLVAGAVVNRTTNDGSTALIYAAQHGHAEIVQALLDIEPTLITKRIVEITHFAGRKRYQDVQTLSTLVLMSLKTKTKYSVYLCNICRTH